MSERWQAVDPRTAFDAERAREAAMQGPTWLAQLGQHYVRFLDGYERGGGQEAMRVAAMEAPFVVELQSELDKLFAASDGGEPKPAGEYIHPKTVEFLKGEQIKALPYTRIKSALWAGIARQYADGKSKPPDQGMANDVEYIATYLPYVDAMFVDRRCWALATANPVAECIAEAGRAGQLFSVGNLDEFDAYLDAIEQSVSDEQRAYADLLYATPPSPSPVSK